MTVAPITVKAARRLVARWHRHLPDVRGGLFAAALVEDGERVAVAIAGHPPRVWLRTGRVVVSRVAVAPNVDPTKNACSRLLGALCRAARALGYSEVWTYTLPEEPGTSLRAAGFEHMGETRGGSWSRPSRRRDAPVRGEPKQRWRRVLRKKPPEATP